MNAKRSVRSGRGKIISAPYSNRAVKNVKATSVIQDSHLSDMQSFLLYGQASRAISTGQLNALQRFHTQPINVLVLNGSLEDLKSQGDLILEGASRLDAFSGYPVRTQLPGNAIGITTGTPEVRPLRSSRTRSSSSQISNAHGRQGPNCLTTF